jgi:hypothetical protein
MFLLAALLPRAGSMYALRPDPPPINLREDPIYAGEGFDLRDTGALPDPEDARRIRIDANWSLSTPPVVRTSF